MKRTIKQKKKYYVSEAFTRKVLDDMETCEENVAFLLKEYPKLRDNDNLLLFNYWSRVDKVKFSMLNNDKVACLTPAESITRARRVMQRDLGYFLPSEGVDDNRLAKAEVLKNNRFQH